MTEMAHQPPPRKEENQLSPLQRLDYSIVQQCMHCGLCLPTCPTYEATGIERHSPRGRISLMRAIADGRLESSRTFSEEIYFCLGCLACMTACPAGVNYAELFEHARAEAERNGSLQSPRRNFLRKFTLGWLFMDLRRLRALGALLRLYQRAGLQTLVRKSGFLRIFPRRLQELEAMTPQAQPKFSSRLIQEVTPAYKAKRFRVALLTGCAQDLIFSHVNRDTAEVLSRNGCEVFTPAQQPCCGSLHAHNGELDLARTLARQMMTRFPPDQFDAIISNAAGCGSHLKHYSSLLSEDLEWSDRAKLWDQKVKDIHEWLVEIGFEPPSVPESAAKRVTYHEACHLCHGQKITDQPRQLLRAIPGIELVELPESTWCCGSAGIYNLIQPEMAGQLLTRKMGQIKKTKAEVVATGNPGCLLQLVQGAKKENLSLEIVHPITLLAEAYKRRA
jgi:glycolate oxidase iron-sulfur subunit